MLLSVGSNSTDNPDQRGQGLKEEGGEKEGQNKRDTEKKEKQERCDVTHRENIREQIMKEKKRL